MSDTMDWLKPCADDLVLHVQPNGELPTPTAARDRIRALPPEQRTARPIRVLIADGTFELAEPLMLGPGDSGTPAAPIIYQAAPGARPRLSGGRRIENFFETVTEAGRVWTARLHDVADASWRFTQLFVNGRRARRARWPKQGFYELRDASADPTSCEARFAPGELKAWPDLDGVELTALHFWLDSHLAVEAVDEAACRVRFKHPAARMLNDERRIERCRYVVENVREALTEPGEWHLDIGTGTVTYLPLPDERLGETTVVAPRLSTLVEIAGEPSDTAGRIGYSDPGRHEAAADFPPDRPGMRAYVERLSRATVHDVHLVGIELSHTEWHYAPGDPGPAQAAFTVPGAVRLTHCCDCSLRLARVAHVGGYGVELGQGARRVHLVGNRLDDLGAGGLKLGHGSHFNTACDNVITRGGRRFPSAIGIWIGHSGDNVVVHNRIHDFYYTGISVGWVWGYRPSRARRNRIEHNHVTRIGQGVLSDMGGIYSLGVSPGTRVCANVFRHVHYFAYGGSGLYPDEGTGYVLYENNVVEDCTSGCIHMNYGRDCLFRNNLLIDGGDAQVAWGTPKHFRPMRVEGNVIVYDAGQPAQGNWFAEPALVEFRRNLWFRRDGRPVEFAGHDWTQWRERGFDVEGLGVDPLLADDTGRLLALRADSPARAIGFKPVDMARVGPRTRVLETGDVSATDDRVGPIAWVQIESAEPVAENARYEDRFIHYPESTPCTLALQAVVENAGDAPFTGDVCIEVDAVTGGAVVPIDGHGGRTETVTLAPGERTTLPVTLSASEGVRELVVRVSGDAPGLFGTVLGLGFRPTVRVPRVEPGIAAADIERALADDGAPELPVTYGRHRLATVKVGVAGDDLVLAADVNDDPVTLRDPVYKGSMIDLFGIGAASRGITGQVTEAFGQVFLVPGGDGRPARLTDSTVGALEGGEVHFEPRPGGYRIAARVPLAALKIRVANGEFGFKAGVYAHVPGATGILRAHLFGERSRNDPHAYGRMVID